MGELIISATSGGSKGARGTPPPPESKFFHAVFAKIWQNRMLPPPPGELAPLLGEILDLLQIFQILKGTGVVVKVFFPNYQQHKNSISANYSSP